MQKCISIVFVKTHTKEREKRLHPLPLALVTINKITLYKNCVSIPTFWCHSLFTRVISALGLYHTPMGVHPNDGERLVYKNLVKNLTG